MMIEMHKLSDLRLTSFDSTHRLIEVHERRPCQVGDPPTEGPIQLT